MCALLWFFPYYSNCFENNINILENIIDFPLIFHFEYKVVSVHYHRGSSSDMVYFLFRYPPPFKEYQESQDVSLIFEIQIRKGIEKDIEIGMLQIVDFKYLIRFSIRSLIWHPYPNFNHEKENIDQPRKVDRSVRSGLF